MTTETEQTAEQSVNLKPVDAPGGKACAFKQVGVVEALLIGSFLLSLMGYWDFIGWPADLASHFKLQYAVLQLVCLIVMLVRKKPQWILVALLGLGMNVAEIAGAYQKDEINPLAPKPAMVGKFRLMQMNVRTENRSYDKAIVAIKALNPDVIAVNEVDSKWLDGLRPATQGYPYHAESPRDDNFGIAIFSRLPLAKTKVHSFYKGGVPSILAALEINKQVVTILATHPLPPTSPKYFEERNSQLWGIARERMKLGEHLIVVGDLNTSPYSETFKHFTEAMGLRDSRRGFGIQATWPSYFLPLEIPIDHMLVSDKIEVISRKVGPDTGSDHFPVVAELGLLKFPEPPGGRMPHGPGPYGRHGMKGMGPGAMSPGGKLIFDDATGPAGHHPIMPHMQMGDGEGEGASPMSPGQTPNAPLQGAGQTGTSKQ